MLPQPKHVITGTELSPTEILSLLSLATTIKKKPNQYAHALSKKQLVLIFEKPSFRTRLSFTIGMQQLGGAVIESNCDQRKYEDPEDLMRVLQGYCDGVMVRTHEEAQLQRMQSVALIPIINGLSKNHHPCQIFADLLTLQEHYQQLHGLTITYIGDGNNILHSLLLLAPQLGIHVHYCCPKGFEPASEILTHKNYNHSLIKSFSDPLLAVADTDAVYTDVWTSMGFEHKNENAFEGFQVNEALMAKAKKNALFMHCMPMNRGKEVSKTLPDQPCSAIFKQSENRLHLQKALLLHLLSEKRYT